MSKCPVCNVTYVADKSWIGCSVHGIDADFFKAWVLAAPPKESVSIGELLARCRMDAMLHNHTTVFDRASGAKDLRVPQSLIKKTEDLKRYVKMGLACVEKNWIRDIFEDFDKVIHRISQNLYDMYLEDSDFEKKLFSRARKHFDKAFNSVENSGCYASVLRDLMKYLSEENLTTDPYADMKDKIKARLDEIRGQGKYPSRASTRRATSPRPVETLAPDHIFTLEAPVPRDAIDTQIRQTLQERQNARAGMARPYEGRPPVFGSTVRNAGFPHASPATPYEGTPIFRDSPGGFGYLQGTGRIPKGVKDGATYEEIREAIRNELNERRRRPAEGKAFDVKNPFRIVRSA
jgi:hypothetical protein